MRKPDIEKRRDEGAEVIYAYTQRMYDAFGGRAVRIIGQGYVIDYVDGKAIFREPNEKELRESKWSFSRYHKQLNQWLVVFLDRELEPTGKRSLVDSRNLFDERWSEYKARQREAQEQERRVEAAREREVNERVAVAQTVAAALRITEHCSIVAAPNNFAGYLPTGTIVISREEVTRIWNTVQNKEETA